jgi:hypothetical protein
MTVEPPLSDFERLLRSSAPQPRAEFVDELERSLVRSLQPSEPARTSWGRVRSGRLRAAGALAGAMAVLVLALAIAGVRPFGTGGTSSAQADRECVTVERVVPVKRAMLEVDSEGRPHVTYRVDSVKRPFIRCR